VGWTEAEEVCALELSGTESTRHIARVLGRTDSAIENRFWKYRNQSRPMPQGWCVTADRKFARAGSANSGAPLPGVVIPMQAAAQPAAVNLTAPDDLSLHGYPRPEMPAPAAVAQKNLPSPCFDAAPQDDLTAHLLALPRDAVWTWDRDSELCELLGLQYTMSAISDDMGIRDRDIQARFDQMTGLDRTTRVRRFIRSAIIGRMALLSGLAAAGDAE
jgi:AraC-like DNA-binding protein